jgi:hypothetical protein
MRYRNHLLECWNNFLDACKKTLAFHFGLGVASASVQGLKILLLSFDGGTAGFSVSSVE